MSKNNKKNFLIQGSILAFAGILVRIIGLIYRIPLTNILGDEGMGYYGTAYDIYSILLLLSSQSMPLAVSKLVSTKIAKNEHKNAYRTFKGALMYGVVVGAVFGLLTYFGADWLAHAFKYPSASRALQVLAPTLALVSIIGVFRGYFQGMGQTGPTAISQVLEQIVNAIVSVVAAYQLYSYGSSIKAISEARSATNAASFGAAGGTLGTCMGAFTAFIVLLIIFFRAKKEINEDIEGDTTSKEDSYLSLSKMLIWTITPVLLSTTIYQIGNFVDNAIYGNIMENLFDVPESMRASIWGVYSGRYKLLTTMPIAIASALSVSVVPAIVHAYISKRENDLKTNIDMAIKFTMILSFPCGIGLSFLGGPINVLLFPSAKFVDMTAKIMLFSVFTVVTFSLSTISNAILQGIDKLKVPIINSGISLVVHLITLPILLIVFEMDVYGIALGDILFSLLICILNARSIKKYLGYKQEITNTFIKPAIASLIMGGIAYGAYYAIDLALHNNGLGIIVSNDIATMIAVMIAIPVYFAVLIFIKCITEEQLKAVPKGHLLIKLCKKMHLL